MKTYHVSTALSTNQAVAAGVSDQSITATSAAVKYTQITSSAVLTGPKGDTGPTGPAGPPGTTDYNNLANRPVIPTDNAQLTNGAGYATASDLAVHADKNYIQDFASASTVSVTHNFGKFPSVTVFDSAGDEVEGDVHHISLNSLTVAFSAPFSGKVICN